jgi:hypothetical protein
MKRQFHSSSPPSSPFSNSQISDELEPAPKRPRIFVSSPTPPPDNDDETEEEEEEEIIIDEPIIPSVTITEDRLEIILSMKVNFYFDTILVKVNMKVMMMMMILSKLNNKI